MRLTLTLLICVLGLAACGGPTSGEEPAGGDYTPVADADLYARVGQVHGVRSVDVGYSDSFGNANTYQGEIEVEPGTDVREVLDRAIAILRQGAPDATMNLTVFSPSASATADDLGIVTPGDLEERYGPQPGSGEPPS